MGAVRKSLANLSIKNLRERIRGRRSNRNRRTINNSHPVQDIVLSSNSSGITPLVHNIVDTNDVIPSNFASTSRANLSETIVIPRTLTTQRQLSNITDKITTDYIKDGLREICVSDNVNRTTVSRLLKLLKPCFPNLTTDYRSLLETPRKTKLVDVMPGKYLHLSILNGLKYITERENILGSHLELNIFVDGVNLYKSSKENNFWVVLADIEKVDNSIFPIGIYQGISKPNSFDDLLKYFVNEYKHLKDVAHPVIKGIKRKIKIKNFLLDTPARASVCGLIGHCGYNSCVRCECKGVRKDSSTVFPWFESNKRTDDSFKNRTDPSFHTRTSIIERELELKMISQFPLDFLHVVLKGCLSRLLNLIILRFRQSRFGINKEIKNSNFSRPNEIHTQYPLIDQLNKWKGHELRIFLLKLGPVILKDYVDQEHYSNFLFLACAFNVLCDEKLFSLYNRSANKLLLQFASDSLELYGESFFVPTVHQTIHMADEVLLQNAPVDNFSTWRFESFLTPIKKLVKTPNLTLSQLHRRIVELYKIPKQKPERNVNLNAKYFYYKGARIDTYSCKDRFLLISKESELFVVVVLKIVLRDQIELLVRKLKLLPPFFTYPANAELFNFYYCAPEYDSQSFYINLEEIERKLMCMIYNDNFVFASVQYFK